MKMLHAVRELGYYIGGKTLYDKINADKVLVLEFDKEGNFLGIRVEDFSEDKLELYLYKKRGIGKGQKPSHTPTLKLSDRKNSEKSLQNMAKALNSLRKLYNKIPNIRIEQAKEEVEKKLKEVSERNILLTLNIDRKYIGEIEEFKKALEISILNEGKESKGKAICFVCKEVKEVSGNISPYKFYTIDKPGYITGGFDKKKAYKNFPLCYDCKFLIEAGRELIEENLKFKLGNITYYLIPEFIYANKEAVEEIMEILTNTEVREHKLRDKEKKHILSNEEEILDILKEYGDFMSVHLLFMEQSQGAERIHLHIQDIYPSRLKLLFKVKEFLEKLIYDEKQEFTYGTIYKFFSKTNSTKKSQDIIKHFLEITDKTFRGVKINKSFLIKYLLHKISSEIKEERSYISTIKDTYCVFLFSLITTGELEMTEVKNASLEEFVSSLPALDTDLKRGLFILGALTERLLRVQASERGSKPFLKKLKGLKMNETDIKGLLPEVRNKLEEYGKFGKGESILFDMASEYFSQSPSKWNMSVDELNFYFALGMGMFDKLAEFIYGKEGANHEEQV